MKKHTGMAKSARPVHMKEQSFKRLEYQLNLLLPQNSGLSTTATAVSASSGAMNEYK